MIERKLILHHENGTSAKVTTSDPQLTNYERRDRRRAALNEGDRVRLVTLAQSVLPGGIGFDDRPNLPPGTEGVVEAHGGLVTDDAGSLFVEWDNGSRLMATGDDRVVKVDDPDSTPL